LHCPGRLWTPATTWCRRGYKRTRGVHSPKGCGPSREDRLLQVYSIPVIRPTTSNRQHRKLSKTIGPSASHFRIDLNLSYFSPSSFVVISHQLTGSVAKKAIFFAFSAGISATMSFSLVQSSMALFTRSASSLFWF